MIGLEQIWYLAKLRHQKNWLSVWLKIQNKINKQTKKKKKKKKKKNKKQHPGRRKKDHLLLLTVEIFFACLLHILETEIKGPVSQIDVALQPYF